MLSETELVFAHTLLYSNILGRFFLFLVGLVVCEHVMVTEMYSVGLQAESLRI